MRQSFHGGTRNDHSLIVQLTSAAPQNTGWIAANNGTCGNILHDNGAGINDRVTADTDSRHNHRVREQARVIFKDDRQIRWCAGCRGGRTAIGKKKIGGKTGRNKEIFEKEEAERSVIAFYATPKSTMCPRHRLRKLGEPVPLVDFEKGFGAYHSEAGRLAKPQRLKVGLLLLK